MMRPVQAGERPVGRVIWIAAAVALLSLRGVAQAEPRSAVSAAAFLDTLGVNTHIAYKDGAYADTRLVARDLRYLGITHVREGIVDHWGPDTASLADYVTLANAGAKFDLVVSHQPQAAPGPSFIETNLAMLDILRKAMPHSIVAVEGPNEINNWPVASYKTLTGVPAALASQRDLYTAVHANPGLRGVQVYDLTGGPQQASLAGRADEANQHPYSHNGLPPGGWIPRGFAEAYAIAGPYPMVITEIGNFSLPLDWPRGKAWWEADTYLGVDEATQAKSILTTYFDAFVQGVGRTYVYELLDQKPDFADAETFMHYGLFRFDHAPKPAATALHNLTAILAAKAPSPVNAASKGRLDYEVTGLPATANSVLLQRADGMFVLALWNEVPFWTWDSQSSHAVTAPPVPVTLTLQQAAGTMQVFDPLRAATAIQVAAGQTAVTLDLVDHPILVAIALAAPASTSPMGIVPAAKP